MRATLIGITLIILGLLQILLYQPVYQGFETSQGTLNYTSSGTGELIITVHGSPGSQNDFRDLAPRLNGKVLNIDMFGFGKSSMTTNYGLQAQADALYQLVESLNQTPIIIGYSWGAGVALHYAHKYPTNGIILLAGMGIQEGEPTGNYWLEHLRYWLSYPFVAWYPGGFGGDIKWRKGFLRSYMDSDQRIIRDVLPEINTPTLIVHGDQDSVIQPWVAQEHNQLIPNSELVFYQGGHGVMFGDTSQVAQIINGWLDE